LHWHSFKSGVLITSSRIPHPEMHTEYIAGNIGSRAWNYQPIEAFDGMNKKFTNPYVIFYPVLSHDEIPFPVNEPLREVQGSQFHADRAWLGSIVVAKYRDAGFIRMMNASMADFPLVKNYLMLHGSPVTIGRVSAPSSPPVAGSSFTAPSAPGTLSTPPSSTSSSASYPRLMFTQALSSSPSSPL